MFALVSEASSYLDPHSVSWPEAVFYASLGRSANTNKLSLAHVGLAVAAIKFVTQVPGPNVLHYRERASGHPTRTDRCLGVRRYQIVKVWLTTYVRSFQARGSDGQRMCALFRNPTNKLTRLLICQGPGNAGYPSPVLT